MAKCIYIYSRNKLDISVRHNLEAICHRLTPDNIPAIRCEGNVAYGILNPTSTLRTKPKSIALGQLLGVHKSWHAPGSDIPDGSFALFRSDAASCELVTDVTASRTIWYYLDAEKIVASTSQRAIILFIQSFEFNERVIPWMISTGTLGPGLSWGRRINQVPAHSQLLLYRDRWSLSHRSGPTRVNADERSEKFHRNALQSTFENLDINFDEWTLPLSGGYDSRGILCLLKKYAGKIQNLKTITWGLEESQVEQGNDAQIAGELARYFDLSHQYYVTDLSAVSPEVVIDRFLRLGEGRVDHIAGYTDGFKLWKTLFEDNIQGIIRGDEGFGCRPVDSALSVNYKINCGRCTDFKNLSRGSQLGIPNQLYPGRLEQRADESLEQWRDRLFYNYQLPVEMAGLSDLKLAYVEVVNPLLSRTILQKVRQLPDRLRTGKALFKENRGIVKPQYTICFEEGY